MTIELFRDLGDADIEEVVGRAFGDESRLEEIEEELALRKGTVAFMVLAKVRRRLAELRRERRSGLTESEDEDSELTRSTVEEDKSTPPASDGGCVVGDAVREEAESAAEGSPSIAAGGEPLAVSPPSSFEVCWSEEPSPDGSLPLVAGRTRPASDSVEEWELEPVHVPRLLPASDPEEFQLHLAALEWDLDPAILIHRAEDIQGRRHWSEHFEPFEHQVRNLITFCRRAPVALIADDVGLGKTISAGLILSELMARGKVRRALVLAPKLLLAQWVEELREKFEIRADHAGGVGLGNLLQRLDRQEIDVVVTTYESARNRIAALKGKGIEMLILDEAHKLRNLYSPNGPPRIAQVLQGALAERMFRYVLMLTATPIQNRLWDIYSAVDLLTTAKGHQNPLGDPDAFARTYIADAKWQARSLKPAQRNNFRWNLSQYMVRTRRVDCDLPFPERQVSTVRAHGHPGEIDLMRVVGEELGNLNALAQVSVAQALMSSPDALVAQLANMADRGTIDHEVFRRCKAIASGIEQTGKQELLLSLVRQLAHDREDWRVVIFTGRLETQTAIGSFLSHHLGDGLIGYIRGGQANRNQKTIKDYSATPPSARIIISTDSGAEGVNLQAGNVVVNYDLPWNPMLLEQRIGRVQRLGSQHARVSVLNLVLEGSVEERVVGRLTEKLSAISATLGDIEGILESLPGGDEESLEQEIRQLVVASLMGRNVEAEAEQIQQSIERAKQVYEEERENVENHLGRLDSMHHDGPLMPELSRVEPRLTEPEFTRGALRSEGADLQERPEGGWAMFRPGRAPEMVFFDRVDWDRAPTDIGGSRLGNLYRSGQPAFEQLVGRWSRQASHHVVDAGPGTEEDVRALVAEWAARFEGLVVEEVWVQPGAIGFQGELVARVGASVAHDKYEKLVDVPVTVEGVEPIDTSRLEVEFDDGGEFDPNELEGPLSDILLNSVVSDEDIGAFSGFYVSRQFEEVERAGGDPDCVRLAEESFTPSIAVEVVGAEGVRFAEATLEVKYSIDGEGSYFSVFVAVPAVRSLRSSPGEGECEVSGRVLPSDALDRCDFSGREVLASLLHVSEHSGRRALPEHMVRCDVSSSYLVEDEVEQSALSGRRANRDLMAVSEISGEWALEEELEQCEFTGVWCLPTETFISEVSQKKYRGDEEVSGGLTPRKGHRSEFVRCEETLDWFLPGEVQKSDVSGVAVRIDLLVASDKDPERFGLERETAVCDASGKRLLSDEAGTCAVTGKTVDLDLLDKSGLSDRFALREHVRVCEKTGVNLLPDELGLCSVTGQIVDRTLLERSQVSGALALREHLVPCAITGRRVLPQELVKCATTGLKVLPDCLRTCVLTGKQSIEKKMVECQETGKWMCAELATFSSSSGEPCLPEVAKECSWSGGAHLPVEVDRCELLRVHVSKEHLNQKTLLAPLIELLDGAVLGAPVPDDIVSAVRGLRGSLPFGKLKKLAMITGPDRRSVVIAGLIRSRLGMRSRYVGLLMREDDGWKVRGSVVEGRRKAGHWTHECSHSVIQDPSS